MRTLSSGAAPLHTPPTLLHGFLGDGLCMLGLLLVHPQLASLPLLLSQLGGSQCSWNACAGVLGGSAQSPGTLAACAGSSWFWLSPCTSPHGTELRRAQGWCHSPVTASTVRHSFPF